MSVTIQMRGDTAVNWTAANPVLAARELALETDTGLYKVGDGAADWNSLPYGGLRGLDETTVLDFEGTSEPAAPAAGHLAVYARSLAGRMLLRIKGPSGLATPLQPSFFQNAITMIGPAGSTTLTGVFSSSSTFGTVSTPAATEQYGFMTNFLSAATANLPAGVCTLGLNYFRGSLAGGANGFMYASRFALPDANYNETGASTGSRIFAGLTAQTGDRPLGTTPSDTLAVDTIGFLRRHVNGGAQDANWLFQTRGGAAPITSVDTGLPFLAGKVYDAFIFCPPVGNEIAWRIDNVTDGLTAEGVVDTNLPTGSAPLRAEVILFNVQALSRNIRVQRLYVEADR
jgi:hypothetical protein